MPQSKPVATSAEYNSKGQYLGKKAAPRAEKVVPIEFDKPLSTPTPTPDQTPTPTPTPKPRINPGGLGGLAAAIAKKRAADAAKK